ncbi:MAG: aminoacyl-tRNA hydrolase [Chromatocurvus sp.]
MTAAIALIVGLGNPGDAYRGTRHNAGVEFVTCLARRHGGALSHESRFFGQTARVTVGGHDIRLLVPDTFMNRSGQAVGAMAGFFKFQPPQLLIAHDELDLAPGVARFKRDGGHGGHNGLRDIVRALGNATDFHRLRIGIGHPGSADRVSPYVLGRAPPGESGMTTAAIEAAADALPLLLDGNLAKAMTQLHSFSAS